MIEKMTVGEIARLWKEDKRKYVKYSTFAAYALIGIPEQCRPVIPA